MLVTDESRGRSKCKFGAKISSCQSIYFGLGANENRKNFRTYVKKCSLSAGDVGSEKGGVATPPLKENTYFKQGKEG